MKLINQFDAALLNTIKSGCDILNYHVAKSLVSLKERKPELLEITKHMVEKNAMLGAIATKKGIEELENYTFIYDLFDKHVFKKKKFKFTKKNMLIMKRLGFEQQELVHEHVHGLVKWDKDKLTYSIFCHKNIVWRKNTTGMYPGE